MINQAMKVTWHIKPFDELTSAEFHDIVALRIDVFVIEQDCIYQDVDGKDKLSWLIFGVTEDGTVVSTARIIPPGISYAEHSIGRVANALSVRGTGVGHQMMAESMAFIKRNFGDVPVRISAQKYLENFYSKFGFQSTGKEYLEDGIPHVEMLYKNNNQ